MAVFAFCKKREDFLALAMKLPGDGERLVHKDTSRPVAECIASSPKRDSPLGEKRWIKQTAETLDLQSTINRRGRPKQEICPLSFPQEIADYTVALNNLPTGKDKENENFKNKIIPHRF